MHTTHTHHTQETINNRLNVPRTVTNQTYIAVSFRIRKRLTIPTNKNCPSPQQHTLPLLLCVVVDIRSPIGFDGQDCKFSHACLGVHASTRTHTQTKIHIENYLDSSWSIGSSESSQDTSDVLFSDCIDSPAIAVTVSDSSRSLLCACSADSPTV